jgi:PAS domain S-box-containing protein
MTEAARPPHETERLAALHQYEILDTPPEQELDDLVHLAAHVCQAPIALISLVDSDRLWFKSKIGLTATQTDRVIAFCSHTILGPDLLVVSDALANTRFADNPLVTGDPHIRSYCGAPLTTPEGHRIGTLSIIDHVPRELSLDQLEALRVLSRQVMEHLTLDQQHRELIQAVNDRARAEQALVEREEYWRLFIEHSPVALAMFDRDMRYLAASRRWMTDYQLGERSLIGLTHYEVFPEIPQRWRDIHRRCLAGAVERCEEDPFVRADGRTHWLRWEILPWRTAGGAIGGIVIFTEDITARKRADEQARRWEQVFEKAEFGLAYGNIADGTLLAVNEAFARQRGYRVDELIGQPILSVYAPDARDAMKARFLEIDRRGHLVFESVHRRKDGTIFPVLMEVTVIKDVQGRPVCRVAYALDITDRNRAYEALQDTYRHLQVLSREVQIAQEWERNRLSRELHDEFGQLLSALKFDLSDVAKGMAKQPPLATTALQKKIGAATLTLDRLFASLREMVHALRSAVLEELGLVPALETLANETRERSGLRCRVVADRDALGKSFGPEFESTLYRMAQELLTNVVRHAKATSATITISRTGGWMKLAVQDNGRGFKISSVQPKARFGLLGVQERAELLGGNVEIHSEPGKGTVVTVRIPIEPSSPGESSVASSRLSKSVAARKRGRHGKQV